MKRFLSRCSLFLSVTAWEVRRWLGERVFGVSLTFRHGVIQHKISQYQDMQGKSFSCLLHLSAPKVHLVFRFHQLINENSASGASLFNHGRIAQKGGEFALRCYTPLNLRYFLWIYGLSLLDSGAP